MFIDYGINSEGKQEPLKQPKNVSCVIWTTLAVLAFCFFFVMLVDQEFKKNAKIIEELTAKTTTLSSCPSCICNCKQVPENRIRYGVVPSENPKEPETEIRKIEANEKANPIFVSPVIHV
ncbi:hypothetical protein L5515_015632 [Caenorhabditis briggsae]|uniref:Uncharacterized protein n=1 Tax=Caenorhabditis briggsae TaxID=6238 RepID=A0AAE9EC87_CAEBR|nr:hypothetical protein L5515_015632 [Caenorhabditis briggsae]